MGWTVDGAKRYLSEFGLKPVLSRISTEQGKVFLSEQLMVDPNNALNPNRYAYYIFSQKNQLKALLITTSIEEEKYLKGAEAQFSRLVKSLIKQTTSGLVSAGFQLTDNYSEVIGEHELHIERDGVNHSHSLRCVISGKGELAEAKQWLDQIERTDD